MQLADLMSLRRTVGAGLLVTLTERRARRAGPRSRAATTRLGRDLDGRALLRFLGTFTPGCRPEVLMLTGGEPLTRPGLVVDAAEAARGAGTRTAVLSRGLPAVAGRLPPAALRVAHAVDHFALDAEAHRDRAAPLDDLLAALDALAETGVATSLHLPAAGPDDRYPEELAAEVADRLGRPVPLWVGEPWPADRVEAPRAAPCELAAWPVVAVDGAVTACCQRDVVAGRRRPAQLRVGSTATDSWRGVLERAQGDPLLRMIRTVGPVHIAARAGAPPGAWPGAWPTGTPGLTCATCHRLGEVPGARRWARRAGEGQRRELRQVAPPPGRDVGGAREAREASDVGELGDGGAARDVGDAAGPVPRRPRLVAVEPGVGGRGVGGSGVAAPAPEGEGRAERNGREGREHRPRTP